MEPPEGRHRPTGEDRGGGLVQSTAFRQRLDRELALAARLGHPFAVIGFECVEPRARPVLRRLGEALRGRVRASDEVGWLGPSELGLLLSATPGPAALRFAEGVCARLAAQRPALRCTVYTYPPLTGLEPGASAGPR